MKRDAYVKYVESLIDRTASAPDAESAQRWAAAALDAAHALHVLRSPI